ILFTAGWAWSVRGTWASIDLRTLTWRFHFEQVLPLEFLAALLPLVTLVAIVVVGLARPRSRDLYAAPWWVASWTPQILMAPLLAVTLAVFALDTARTDSWTLGRQNLETLGARLHCGLADDVEASIDHESEALAQQLTRRGYRTLVNPNKVMYF